MSVLVLGGAGYIGSHTVYQLIAEGFDVVVADNLSTGHREAVHPAAKFYKGDIRDRAFLDSLFAAEKTDGVIHFAACSIVGESMKLPLKYYNNNLCGTETLLEAMTAAGVPRIVFSSTAAVYGEPESVPIPETAKKEPTNCYGETKLAMERMFGWSAKAGGPSFAALRYFNACGAHPNGLIGEGHDPETHLIPLILRVPAGLRDSITVFGDDYPTPDGTCIRDYVHVMDLARAHVLALRYLERGGESGAFNLGCGEGFSVMEVIDAARRVTGHPIPAVMAPRRSGDPARLVASSDKARKILGWEPEYTSLDRIIGTAWAWHKSRIGK